MINKLILGTVQLGLDYGINNQFGKPSLEKAFEILHTAYDNGIRILDTAEAYGNSQEIIGKFQKENPNNKFQIITKLAANQLLKNNDLFSQILKNCIILNTDKLDGYMFHNYQSFRSNTKLYEVLLSAREKGLIKRAGISLYKNKEVEDIMTNYNGFDFIQIPFNLFDNESKRKIILEKAKAKGIEIHTRSVFLQGIFFKKNDSIPEKLKPLIPYLNTINYIKESKGISTETLALQYVLHKEYIDHVLIGVERVEQLINNINSCKEKHDIPHDNIDAINITEEDLLNPSNW